MFTAGFGVFIFFTILVIAATLCIYNVNKTDRLASVKMKEIELEEKRLEVEKAKYDLQMKQSEMQM